MTGVLTVSARQFLDEYRQHISEWENAAKAARRLVREVLGPLGPMMHHITGRAKTVESVREKLLRKQYGRPVHDVTDAVGVRVVTYYTCDVDKVVRRVTEEFKVDPRRSIDKRSALGVSEFGYRSVHLIVQLTAQRARSPEYAALQGRVFEIQVRSILEDSWAEFNHQMIYKSGVQYQEESLRRLAGFAGMLELLDHEFAHMWDERRKIIEGLRERYECGRDMARPLDSGRLVAFLLARRPTGPSWLEGPDGTATLPQGTDRTCLDALRAIGINTPNALAKVMRSRAFQRALASFADANDIDKKQISHFAIVVLAVATRDPNLLAHYFPDLLSDPTLHAITHRRIRSKAGPGARSRSRGNP